MGSCAQSPLSEIIRNQLGRLVVLFMHRNCALRIRLDGDFLNVRNFEVIELLELGQEGATPRQTASTAPLRSRLGAAFSCPGASAKPTWMTLLKIPLRKGGGVSGAFR